MKGKKNQIREVIQNQKLSQNHPSFLVHQMEKKKKKKGEVGRQAIVRRRYDLFLKLHPIKKT